MHWRLLQKQSALHPFFKAFNAFSTSFAFVVLLQIKQPISLALLKNMARLLFILWMLGADGTKTASVKNRNPSILMADHQSFVIRRRFQPCSQSDTNCLLTCSAVNVQEATLTWFRGNQVCSQVSVIDLNPNPSLHLEVENKDNSNYRCVLSSPDSSQTLYANITQLCECLYMTQTVVPVKKGDSVTLHTSLKEIQNGTHIVWKFGPEEIVIAEIIHDHMSTCDVTRGRQLSTQNGDLTITNTSKRDSGIYELQIISNISKCWSFNVTVCDPLPSPQIFSHSNHCPSSGSKCVVQCAVSNVSDVTLSWYKGNSLLSSITVSDVNYSMCLNLDYNDNGNYSCVVSSSLMNETKYLIISEVCSDQIYDNTLTIWLCVVLPVLLLVLFALVKYCKWKQRPEDASSNPANQNQPLITRPPTVPNFCCK